MEKQNNLNVIKLQSKWKAFNLHFVASTNEDVEQVEWWNMIGTTNERFYVNVEDDCLLVSFTKKYVLNVT